MTAAAIPITPILTPAQIRDRAEAALQAALAMAAPAFGQTSLTPIFGTMPRPGHVFPAPPPPAIALTQHLFAR